MNILLNLTEHNWSKGDQWRKFADELQEFVMAVEAHIRAIRRRDRNIPTYVENVIKEGLDVCKSLQKYYSIDKDNLPYEIMLFDISSSTLYSIMQGHLSELMSNEPDGRFILSFISSMLQYLVQFSKENNLSFECILSEHDETQKNRGTKEKIYISEDDKKTLIYLHESIKDVVGKEEHAIRLINMINRIEK